MPRSTRRSFAALVVALAATGATGASAKQATPPATPVFAEESGWLDDPRDLNSRPWKFEGVTLRFVGEVKGMEVAPPERGYFLREKDDYDYFFRSWLSVSIPIPGEDFDTVNVMVGFDDDPAGVNEGVTVEIVGVLDGEYQGENAFGADSEWPFIRASSVTVVE